MAMLDSSIVNISLPAIASSFGTPLNGAVTWVTIAYLIVMASVLLTAGRLADIIGRRPVWTVGLCVFTAGSALCGAVPSLGLLIAARAIQGLGGALMLAVSPAMVTSGFPVNERGQAMGWSLVNVALAISAGPTIGGFILSTLSWRWIFYVNVPIGIVAILATRLLPNQDQRHAGERFDPWGALLLAIGLAGITLALSFGESFGWGSPLILGCLIIGIVCLLSLAFVERHVASPIIDVTLLKRRPFLFSVVSYTIAMMALFAVGFILPFYLEQLRGFQTQLSGLLLTPLSLILVCVAPLSGRLADRIGARWLAAGGLALSGIGLISLTQLQAQSSFWDIIWRLLLVGVGQGLFQAPNSSTIMKSAPREQQGVAAGFLATSRVIGQCMSVALAGAIFTGLGGAQAGHQLVILRTTAAISHTTIQSLQDTFFTGFQTALWVCGALAVVGVLTSLVHGEADKK
jgi:drug resistance transporter, EmrB/QacA subfamily